MPRAQSPGKHPITVHGLDDATVETDQISAWWTWHPSANIGLRTGEAFDVLDVDGDEGLAHLEAAGCFLDPYGWDGPEVVTSKGFHRYLLPAGGGNRAGIVPKVDYRGRGGYVVAPPSLHVTGLRYCWGVGGPAVPLEPMPDWLRMLMAPKRRAAGNRPIGRAIRRGVSASTAGMIAMVETATEGERNTCLHWAACRVGEDYRRGKLTGVDAKRTLGELQLVAMRIGLREHEATGTIKSGFRAGSGVAA